MESRLYAEDPYRNFLPSIGRLTRYRPPAETAGLSARRGPRRACRAQRYRRLRRRRDFHVLRPDDRQAVFLGPGPGGGDRGDAHRAGRVRGRGDRAQPAVPERGHTITSGLSLARSPRPSSRRNTRKGLRVWILDETMLLKRLRRRGGGDAAGDGAARRGGSAARSAARIIAAPAKTGWSRSAGGHGRCACDPRMVTGHVVTEEGNELSPDLERAATHAKAADPDPRRRAWSNVTFDDVSDYGAVEGDWTPGDRMTTRDDRRGKDVGKGRRPAPKASASAIAARIFEREGTHAHGSAELAKLMPEKLPPDTSKMLLCPMPGLSGQSIAVDVKATRCRTDRRSATVEAMKMENVLRAEKKRRGCQGQRRAGGQPGGGRR